MTQEEKAKAYDEALERARKQRADYQKELDKTDKSSQLAGILRVGISAIDMAFPELAESEDERIRKEMIDFLKSEKAFQTIDLPISERWIAYLEKQKDPAPIPDKFSGLKSLMLQYLQSAANRKDDAEIEDDTDLWGRKILDYVWKQEGKQKESLGDISTILLIKKWIDERKELWNKSRKEAIALDCSTLADDAVVRIEELNSIISFLGTIQCNSTEKQKEKVVEFDHLKQHKPVQSDEEREYVRILKSLISDFIRDNYKTTDITFYQQIYDWLDGRHIEQKPETITDATKEYTIREDYTSAYYEERGYARGYNDGIRDSKLVSSKPPQKPEEKQDYSGLNDLERAIHRGFLAAGLEDVPVTIIKETAQECLSQMKPAEWSKDLDEEIKRFYEECIVIHEAKVYGRTERVMEVENYEIIARHFAQWQKEQQQEWSEEDERMRNALWNLLKIQYAQDYSMTGVGIEAGKFRDWLKSLRPSWKPSKEQMEQLQAVCKGTPFYNGFIISLYNDLEKLM